MPGHISNSNNRLFYYRYLLIAVLILVSILSTPVKAFQTQEPEIVTAYNDQMICGFTDQPLRRYIQVYAVGSPAGNAYSQAVFKYQTFTQDMTTGICTPDDYIDLPGTFTGGPNGLITFPIPNDVFVTTCQVNDGKEITCNFEYEGDTWQRVFIIENPGAFRNAGTDQPSSATGGCNPNVSGLTPAKPGDVISPLASYVDATGKPVGIIQERWFFNGKETTSTVWDGKEVAVELQWTCLDHSAFSRNYTISAYGGDPATSATGVVANNLELPGKGNENSETPLVTPLGIGVIISGIVGLLGIASVGIGYVIKNKPAGKGADVEPPTVPPVFQPQSKPYIPDSPKIPSQSISPVQNPPASRNVTSSSHQVLTPERRAELSSIRDQMRDEMEKLKEKWRANRDAVDKLSKLKKKNMIKFLTKKGFDVQQWVINSPVEVINNLTVDPVMEKVLQKHDTSQDGKIIVEINNRIQGLKAEMQSLTDEVKYLQKEISKIEKILAK